MKSGAQTALQEPSFASLLQGPVAFLYVQLATIQALRNVYDWRVVIRCSRLLVILINLYYSKRHVRHRIKLVKSFFILLPYTSILVTQYVLCLGSLNKFVLIFFFYIPYTNHVHTCVVYYGSLYEHLNCSTS